MSKSIPRPDAPECADCGMPMAPVRSDYSAIAWLFRFECVACPARGTVEVRDENSVAARAPLTEYHGRARPVAE